MGFHRHAAEFVGRGRRRHQERHHGDHSGAARRVRRQRCAGNDSDLPRGTQALRGRDQRRAGTRDGVESRIVTIAREALAKFRAPVWGGQITNRADLLMALGQAKAPANITPKAARRPNRPAWAAIERSIKAIRGNGVRDRRDAQAAGGIVLPHCSFGNKV